MHIRDKYLKENKLEMFKLGEFDEAISLNPTNENKKQMRRKIKQLDIDYALGRISDEAYENTMEALSEDSDLASYIEHKAHVKDLRDPNYKNIALTLLQRWKCHYCHRNALVPRSFGIADIGAVCTHCGRNWSVQLRKYGNKYTLDVRREVRSVDAYKRRTNSFFDLNIKPIKLF